jgi:hypothetical protein
MQLVGWAAQYMRLYLDTTILNDAYVLLQTVVGQNVHARDFKLPPESWMLEYVALFYLLDLDDQWDLEFGTSLVTQHEIDNIPERSSYHEYKKIWLLDLCEMLGAKVNSIDTSMIPISLRARITSILPPHRGKRKDVAQICQAILGGWESFVTTDRKSILRFADELQDVGIAVATPLTFIEDHFLPIDVLVGTLHGSWTCVDDVVRSWYDQIRSMIQE